MSERQKYIVVLPEEGVGVREYSDMPKEGVTVASSVADAVGHVVFRNISDRTKGRVIVSRLKDLADGDLEKYVFEVPEVVNEDGSQLPIPERYAMQENALAQELAGGKTPSIGQIQKSRLLLRSLD